MRRRSLAVLTAAVGVALLGWLVARAGVAAFAAALARMPAAMLLVVVLEGVRIVVETWGTRASLGPSRAPRGAVLRAQLVGYAVCYVAPLGRAVAEACKAWLLSARVPRGRAVGAALVNQGAALVAVGLASAACSGAGFTRVLALHAAATLVAGVLVLAAAARRSGATLPGAATALAAMLVSRALQGSSIAVLLRAAGDGASISARAALVAWGAHLVGASLGDVVPAQLGATDGALVAAAPAAGLHPGAALAIASAMRAAQLVWVAAGAAAFAAARRLRPASSPGTACSSPSG